MCLLLQEMESKKACPECDKEFKYASRLQRHLASHPSTQPEWKVYCSPCSRPFYTQYDYNRHILTINHIKKIEPSQGPTSPQTPVQDEACYLQEATPLPTPVYEDITPVVSPVCPTTTPPTMETPRLGTTTGETFSLNPSPVLCLSPSDLCGTKSQAESPLTATLPPTTPLAGAATNTIDDLYTGLESVGWLARVNRTSIRLRLAGHFDGLLTCLAPFHQHEDLNPGYSDQCPTCALVVEYINMAIRVSEPRLLDLTTRDNTLGVPL